MSSPKREPVPPGQIVGVYEVRRLCGGISRPTLIRWRTQPGFPEPIRKLKGNVELWDARDVRAWLKQRETR